MSRSKKSDNPRLKISGARDDITRLLKSIGDGVHLYEKSMSDETSSPQLLLRGNTYMGGCKRLKVIARDGENFHRAANKLFPVLDRL